MSCDLIVNSLIAITSVDTVRLFTCVSVRQHVFTVHVSCLLCAID